MTTASNMNPPFPARAPAAAYDDLLARVLPQARGQRVWNPSDGPLPSLFVSRGAPFTLDEWAVDALSRGDADALTDYRDKAPGAAVARPTADHFVPLLFTVGAADDPGSAVSAIDRRVMDNSTRSVRLA